jgi:hypothetical protein
MKAGIVSCVLVASLLAQTAGCYNWVPVSPGEATKLSGSFVAPVGNNVIAIRTVNVRQPDGHMVQLEGNYPVRVTLKGGEVHEFSAPVDVTESGEGLVFRGGDEEPLTTSEDGIDMLEARKMNMGLTAVAATLAGLAGAALVYGLVLAVTPKPPPPATTGP